MTARADYLKSLLPRAGHRVIDANGNFDTAWYRFFQVFIDVFVGSAGSYTLPEILGRLGVPGVKVADDDYGNLFVVVRRDGKATLVTIRY